ncbi:MAG: hypothetical protein KGY45_03750 [Hadesarchaea archaeon]|nr:hypothetical protein [Hadesarchaea archaeon]
MSSEKDLINKAKSLIKDLEINEPSKAEGFEKCETLARMAPLEVIEMIEDPEVKDGVDWLKEAHKTGFPSLIKWREAFAQIIQSLFGEVGGIKKIKRWHELEAVCDEIPESELEELNDDLRKPIEWVKKIHDRTPERRTELINKINEKTEETQE